MSDVLQNITVCLLAKLQLLMTLYINTCIKIPPLKHRTSKIYTIWGICIQL
jgi:hypothetical protein